jgi:hypothetical protein
VIHLRVDEAKLACLVAYLWEMVPQCRVLSAKGRWYKAAISTHVWVVITSSNEAQGLMLSIERPRRSNIDDKYIGITC